MCDFIGSNTSKSDWLGSMVTTWVAAVKMLALLAGNFPQAAYARFTVCLQSEWQYMQCMTSAMAPHFAPLEVAIRTKFFPSLLGIATLDLDSSCHTVSRWVVLPSRTQWTLRCMSTGCPRATQATLSPQWSTGMLTWTWRTAVTRWSAGDCTIAHRTSGV